MPIDGAFVQSGFDVDRFAFQGVPTELMKRMHTPFVVFEGEKGAVIKKVVHVPVYLEGTYTPLWV